MLFRIITLCLILLFVLGTGAAAQEISEEEIENNRSKDEAPIVIIQPSQETPAVKIEDKPQKDDIYEKYLKEGTPHTNLRMVKEQIERTEAELSRDVLDRLKKENQ